MARTNRSRQATFRDAQALAAARARRRAETIQTASANTEPIAVAREAAPAKTETPRTRNREWGFFGTCEHNGHADPEAAWDEAMAALTDSKGPYYLDPDDARDLLDSTWGRHLADQVVGATDITRVVRTIGWTRDARRFVREHINPRLPAERKPVGRDERLAEISREYLKIETLETRKSDDLDFHEFAVWTIREALLAAYEAGRKSARR